MKVFFVITIDTEIDRSPDWKVSTNETFSSVLEGIPKKLTPLFNKFGAKPTYLLSSEVIENNNCLAVLKNIKNCELGTHLHGDLIEPQKTVDKLSGAFVKAMQSFYPKEIEYQKLKNLTDLFIRKFGYQPKSFRAGRFAVGNNTINSLEKLGYLIDSSITPGIDWNYPEGRANFLQTKEQPYFPSRENFLKAGDSKILEIPVSIFSSSLRKIKIPTRICEKLFPATWLRPSFQSLEEMLQVIKKLIKKHQRKEIVILNMMFHSMEVIPGASPYVQTEKESKELLEKIERTLKYAKTNGFNFVTLSGLYPYLKR